MNIKTPAHAGHISMMQRSFGPRFLLDTDNNSGGNDGRAAENAAIEKAAAEKAAAEKAEAERVAAEKAAAEKAEADKLAAEKAQIEEDRKSGKLTDKEFEFLTDALKHKQAAREAKAEAAAAAEKLKMFDGIDPAKIKDLIAKEAKAQEDKKKAEREAIEKSGDIERIKKMMAEEHEKVVEGLQAQLQEKDVAFNSAQRTIEDLTVGSAFSQSKYVAEELVLTPQIARQVYSPHFDVVKGVITPFDKPRGEPERTPMLDASGKPLAVDAALKKLIEASPDRDKLVRSTIAPGAGSRTDNNRSSTDNKTEGAGLSRIEAALAAGALVKAKQ